jgi:hypothetical protein
MKGRLIVFNLFNWVLVCDRCLWGYNYLGSPTPVNQSIPQQILSRFVTFSFQALQILLQFLLLQVFRIRIQTGQSFCKYLGTSLFR